MADFRESFPLTLRLLGGSFPAAESVEAFVRAVCDAHPRGDIPHRAVRDLVRYEALVAELPRAPAAPTAPPPGPDARCRLAPHARLYHYGAGLRDMLPALREERPFQARPSRGWVLLTRDADGALRERWLSPEEGWSMESFREGSLVSEAVEDEEERAVFEAAWNDGALVAL